MPELPELAPERRDTLSAQQDWCNAKAMACKTAHTNVKKLKLRKSGFPCQTLETLIIQQRGDTEEVGEDLDRLPPNIEYETAK